MFGIKSVVLFSVVISLSIFSFVILSYQYEIKNGSFVSHPDKLMTPIEFYSKSLNPNEKQIFILGSSQVIALNPNYIDNILFKNNLDYEIYNLASISDTPNQRLQTLDMLISSKPEIVLYGIGPRDFQNNEVPVTKKLLPDPQAYFISFLNTYKNSFGFDASLFEFPQRTTLSYIVDFVRGIEGKSDIIPYDNAPFMTVRKASTIINDNFGNTGLTYHGSNFSKGNLDYIGLQKILSKLQENNIDVILFVVPQHQSILDNYSEDYIESFNLFLDEIGQTQNLKIHNLFSKYSELNIWNDPSHIAINPQTNIYSDNIAKIIIQEIKQ